MVPARWTGIGFTQNFAASCRASLSRLPFACRSRRMKTPQRWQADLSLALVALVWGSTFVVVKRALTEISTVYFLALRFGLASVCMLLIFMPAFIRAGRATVRKGLQGGAAAGLLLWLG